MDILMEEAILKHHLEEAVHWLTGPACSRDDTPVGTRGAKMPLRTWKGAIRGEYRAATRTWDSFCPVWHTGQAVKALVLAAEALGQKELLDDAAFCADFSLGTQLSSGPDRGLITAYEDDPRLVNTSAILETLDGLLMLSEASGNPRFRESALAALSFVRDRLWDPERKRFHDLYDPAERRIVHGVRCAQGRPLLDDAVFCKGWHLTGDESLLRVALDTAETLLETESPPGNWIAFIPCSRDRDSIHPRHAYWWGNPMFDLYEITSDRRYLECFKRSVEWYRRALRRDGGFLRGTGSDFRTDSFEHATSGSACAALMFLRSLHTEKDPRLEQALELALSYCCRMQFTHPSDPNLRGAILEKVLYPDGSDASPYHIRDLGTIFFIQAASRRLTAKHNGVLP